MKAKFTLAIIATATLITACGGNHEKVYAVDKIEEAQKQALEKAPKAEEIKFADHGQTPMGGVGGANPQQPTAIQAAESTKAAAVAEALTTAHHGAATNESATANEAVATADATKTDTPKADTAKTDETPSETPKTDTQAPSQ